MTPAPPNAAGVTHIDSYDDMISRRRLVDQLAHHGVTFERRELPHIAGMGGAASVITYTSPHTGDPVTVLIVPHQYDIDRFAEDYFYLAGVDAAAAAERDWAAVYDECMKMRHG